MGLPSSRERHDLREDGRARTSFLVSPLARLHSSHPTKRSMSGASPSMLIAEDNCAEEQRRERERGRERERERERESWRTAIINEYKRRVGLTFLLPFPACCPRLCGGGRERRSFIIRFCWVTSTRPSELAGQRQRGRRRGERKERERERERERDCMGWRGGRRRTKEHLGDRPNDRPTDQ